MGDGDPVGPAQGLSAVVARRRLPGGPGRLDPAHSARQARPTAASAPLRPFPRPRSRSSTGDASRSGRRLRLSPRTPKLGGRAEAVLEALRRTARCSSMRSSTRPGCSAPRSSRRLANSSRRGSSRPTDLRACARYLTPSSQRKPHSGLKRRGRVLPFAIESGGRWALVRRVPPARDDEAKAAAVEHVARTLLGRYGVVFWRLMAREAGWLPPWRDLARVYRRLESRGEIRGGRFVAGVTGEQFALPEAIAAMREVRRRPQRRPICVAVGRRSAEPRRRADARRPARRTDRQPTRLSRRPAGRLPVGARGCNSIPISPARTGGKPSAASCGRRRQD